MLYIFHEFLPYISFLHSVALLTLSKSPFMEFSTCITILFDTDPIGLSVYERRSVNFFFFVYG